MILIGFGMQMQIISTRLSEILKVVYEIRQLPPLIHFITGRHHTFGQWARATGEHSDLGYLMKNDMMDF